VLVLIGMEISTRSGHYLAMNVQEEISRDQPTQAIATSIGASWSVPITEPGAYRLEAARMHKPWIFSNPIYVRPSPSDASPSSTSDAP
jgi:hypothetical protein